MMAPHAGLERRILAALDATPPRIPAVFPMEFLVDDVVEPNAELPAVEHGGHREVSLPPMPVTARPRLPDLLRAEPELPAMPAVAR